MWRDSGALGEVLMARLHEVYKEKIIHAMMKEFNYKNIMEVPRLEKIVINMGLGEAIQNPKILDAGVEQLAVISSRAQENRMVVIIISSARMISRPELRRTNFLSMRWCLIIIMAPVEKRSWSNCSTVRM